MKKPLCRRNFQWIRKCVAVFLVLAFVGGTLAPIKTEAQLFVPVFPTDSLANIAHLGQGTLNTVNSTWDFLKESGLDAITSAMSQAIINQMTSSVVNWINGGFEGSPAFLTDPGAFGKNILDETVGEFLYDERSPLRFLCEPFQLDVRFALGLNIYLPFKKRVRCTLSDIIDNAKGSVAGFMDGDFNQGGWAGWLAITSEPGNSPYGSFIAGANELSIRNAGQLSGNYKLLDFGKGFFSVKDKNGKITTPGSFIESQLNSTLDTGKHKIAVADEINEIIGALLNQLVTQALGGSGGLRGLSSPSAGSSESATASLAKISPAEASKLHPEADDYCNERANSYECIARNQNETIKSEQTKEQQDEYNRKIKAGLADKDLVVSAEGDFSSRSTPTQQTESAQNLVGFFNNNPNQNVTQSSLATSLVESGPQNAIDGNREPSENYVRLVSTSQDKSYPWWEIDLGATYNIEYVQLWRALAKTEWSREIDQNTYIFVTNDRINGIPDFNIGSVPLAIKSNNGIEEIPITTFMNKTGRYLRVQRKTTSNQQLIFAEIAIYGTSAGGGVKNTTNAPVSSPTGVTIQAIGISDLGDKNPGNIVSTTFSITSRGAELKGAKLKIETYIKQPSSDIRSITSGQVFNDASPIEPPIIEVKNVSPQINKKLSTPSTSHIIDLPTVPNNVEAMVSLGGTLLPASSANSRIVRVLTKGEYEVRFTVLNAQSQELGKHVMKFEYK